MINDYKFSGSALLASVVVLSWSSGSVGGDSRDCPQPDELLKGVEIRCGDDPVEGKLSPTSLVNCQQDGDKKCITTDALPAVDAGAIRPEVVRIGVQIGGVTGTYRNEIDADTILACIADGQKECAVTGSIVAFDTSDVGSKILAGEIAAGISGLATLDAVKYCSSDRELACLAVPDFPAIQGLRLDKCLEAAP